MFCAKCGETIKKTVYVCPICNIKICGLCQKKGFCNDCFIEENKLVFVNNYFSDKYGGVLKC